MYFLKGCQWISEFLFFHISEVHFTFLLVPGNLAAVVEVVPLRTLKPTPGYPLTGTRWPGF